MFSRVEMRARWYGWELEASKADRISAGVDRELEMTSSSPGGRAVHGGGSNRGGGKEFLGDAWVVVVVPGWRTGEV